MAKIKKPRKQKTARQLIIIDNDALFRKIINARDVICQKTGRPDRLQVAHFWSRGRLRTRWDLDNAVLLGAGVLPYVTATVTAL